jgi:hypothetical protein
VAFSCTDDFDEINTNPVEKEVVPTSTLLTSALQNFITLNSSLNANKTIMLYTQQWSQRETTSRSTYGDGERDWDEWYLNGMPEIDNILDLNQGENAANYIGSGATENQIGVAKILRAWAFMNITDTWGDVPYSQAHSPDFVTPKYDRQSDIYPSLIAELKAAASMLNPSAPSAKGDLVYNGNVNGWIKFANSLRARLAMRMSEVDPAAAQAALTDALSAPVFESNADNAVMAFQPELNQSNPLYQEFDVQMWTYISKPLVDLMTQNNTITDPRLPIYASPNQSGLYVGLPYGLDDGASSAIAQDSCSYPGTAVRAAEYESVFMTYYELLFIRAEAAQRGWISGDAAALYNQAVKANMAFWGVDASAGDAYLAQPSVQYNASNWRQILSEQKYISLYMQGYQVWSEWRRLDFPVLELPPAAQNGATDIPRRFFYNTTERSLNGSNLEAAVAAMGGDNFNVRVWWDK